MLLLRLKVVPYETTKATSLSMTYSKTCLKRQLKKKTKIGFQDRLSLNVLGGGGILQYFIKLPFTIKNCLSFFEWPLKTGFIVLRKSITCS